MKTYTPTQTAAFSTESTRATATARAVRLAGMYLVSKAPDSDTALSDCRRVRLADMYLVSKARQQARDSGTYRAALNLRKSGCPINVALSILKGGV